MSSKNKSQNKVQEVVSGVEVANPVKTSEVNKAEKYALMFFAKSDFQNMDVVSDLKDLKALYARYRQGSKNAVLKAIERVIRFANAGGGELKPIAEMAEQLKAGAAELLGNGVPDSEMRARVNLVVERYAPESYKEKVL